MGRVVVDDDDVHDPADGYLAFDLVEEAGELLVPMMLQEATYPVVFRRWR